MIGRKIPFWTLRDKIGGGEANLVKCLNRTAFTTISKRHWHVDIFQFWAQCMQSETGSQILTKRRTSIEGCPSTYSFSCQLGPVGRRSCKSRILWHLQGLVHKMEASPQTALWLWQRGSRCMSNHVHQTHGLASKSAWTCTVKIKCPTTLRWEEATNCEDAESTKRQGRD